MTRSFAMPRSVRTRKPLAELFVGVGEETAFWLQFDPRVLRQHLGREDAGFQIQVARFALPHDAVALASVSLFLGLSLADGRPTLGLRVGVSPAIYLPLPPANGGAKLRTAIYRLLRAWPGRRLVLLPVPSRKWYDWPVAYFYLLPGDPPPATWRGRRSRCAVVATALLRILSGASPEDAIHSAIASPYLPLVGEVPDDLSFWDGEGCVESFLPLGTPPIPAEYGWIWGDSLYRAWRDGVRVGGMAIRAGSVRWVDGDVIFTDLDPLGSIRREWLVAAQLQVSPDWGDWRCLLHVDYEPVSLGEPTRYRAWLRTVIEAWPAEQRVLAVRQDTLRQPNPALRAMYVGLRLWGAPIPVVRRVFYRALAAAAQGASREALARWLAGLDARKVRGLEVLEALA